MIVEKYGEFVNDQTQFQLNQSKRFSAQPFRRDLHLATATNLSGLFTIAKELEAENAELKERIANLEAGISESSTTGFGQLPLRPEDIDDLPDDVRQELSVSASDPADFRILTLINDAGGVMTLDRIIIGLYRVYGEKIKRPTLVSRINRMIPKNILYPVPGRKGIYTTNAPGSGGAASNKSRPSHFPSGSLCAQKVINFRLFKR